MKVPVQHESSHLWQFVGNEPATLTHDCCGLPKLCVKHYTKCLYTFINIYQQTFYSLHKEMQAKEN